MVQNDEPTFFFFLFLFFFSRAPLARCFPLALIGPWGQVLDQIIVTQPGADPPDLDGELEGKGITRPRMFARVFDSILGAARDPLASSAGVGKS